MLGKNSDGTAKFTVLDKYQKNFGLGLDLLNIGMMVMEPLPAGMLLMRRGKTP